MPLSADQTKLHEMFEQLATIDDELDEISAAEGVLDRRRRALSDRRLSLENDLRLAYYAIGSPGSAVSVGHRVILFEYHRTGIQSFKAITPYAFAVMAAPAPEAKPDLTPAMDRTPWVVPAGGIGISKEDS